MYLKLSSDSGNPLEAVTFQLPASDNYDKSRRTDPLGKSIAKDAPQWGDLQTSLQWSFFRRSVELLKQRGNRIFVLVGPFNEHMLKAESIDTYRKMKSEIQTWLRHKNVAYYMPPALPSEFYRDASHPLGRGYAILAKQLFENDSFRSAILPAPIAQH